jgi:hypothetical protein
MRTTWKNGEACLFMDDINAGYHLSGADLVAEPVKSLAFISVLDNYVANFEMAM